MKKLHSVVAVVGIVALAGAAWWWQNGSRSVAPGSGSPQLAADPPPGGARVPGAPPGGARGPGGPPGGGGPAVVEAAGVERVTLTDDVQAVGTLSSAQGVMLRPEVSGRIARFGFADGARVRRGQLLVQLDDTLQQAQLRQAQAQASIARTNLERGRELLGQGFVSQSAVDQNAAALEVAEAQVALARAQAARMRLVAPFDATAGIRQVDVGDYVKDGADIVNLEDLGTLSVDFSLPERYLSRLKAGQPVQLTLDAMPGRTFAGRVQALDSQVDANGRALLVRARVDNPGAMLRPGMFARPRVVFAVRENALVVPEEALVPVGARQYVWRVTQTPPSSPGDAPASAGVDGPPGAGGASPAGPGAGGGVGGGTGGGARPPRTAERVEVQVGLRLPGKVELLSGIGPGDVVVTAGQSRLRGERAPVRLMDAAAPAPGPAAAAAAARPVSSAPTAAPAAAPIVRPTAAG